MVFDLTTTSDHWWPEVGGMFVLSVIGLLSIFIPERVRRSRLYHGPRGAAAKVFGLAFFLLTGGTATGITISHFRHKATYEIMQREGKLSFLEGCLKSFHPMPSAGHEYERIEVAGHQFRYSDFDISSPAFNNTEAYGGPIHSDSAVKIWYVGNDIIRLAVKDHACAAAPDVK